MKLLQRSALALLLSTGLGAAGAAVTSTGPLEIRWLTVYDDFGSGQVLIGTSNTSVPECASGVYLNPAAPGMDRMYRTILATSLSRLPVRFQVYNDRLFSGSKPYCEVDAVMLDFQ
jgi:hypothetical protein